MRVLTLLTKGFAGAALLLAVPSTALAQGHVITQMFGKKSTAVSATPVKAHQNVPGKFLGIVQKPSAFPSSHKVFVPYSAKKQSIKGNLTTNNDVELWGSICYQDTWTQDYRPYGLYTFNASSPIQVDSIGLDPMLQANGGAAYYDGKYHYVNYLAMLANDHRYYEYDVESKQITRREDLPDYSLVAEETAYDGINHRVYGIFWSADMSALQLGIADYSNLTRTTIGNVQHNYVALGVTSKDSIYGITNDGDLYRISSVDATETLIKNLGINLQPYGNGQYYLQGGEIDQRTDIFYWLCVDKDGRHTLYKVNVENGDLTKIDDMPNGSQLQGIVIPDAVDGNVPARVEDAQLIFTDSTTNGTLMFTAPDKTYNGNVLTGTVNYTVSNNEGQTIASGSAQAGTAVSINVTLPEGAQRVGIVVSNDKGNSREAFANAWVGFDTPSHPENAKLNKDSLTAKVTWDAPSYTLHDGYMGDLSYDVFRYSENDSLQVAKGLKATHFEENLPEEINNYNYVIYAKNSKYTSTGISTDTASIGNYIIPPYSQDFSTAASANGYLVLDKDSDNKTWNYSDEWNAFECRPGNDSSDDWLLTPLFKFEGSRSYQLSFRAWSPLAYYKEKFHLAYGTGDDPTSYTLLGDTINLNSTDGADRNISLEIKTTADGLYRIGFHNISDAGWEAYTTVIDNIKVEPLAYYEAPDSATSFKITPDPQGAAQAVLAFNAPTVTVSGNPIASLDSISIERNDSVVAILKDVAPGKALTYTDTNVTPNGLNTYKVYAFNAKGFGRPATKTAFVGQDTPEPPDVDLIDNATAIHAQWQKVSNVGENGYYVNPDQVHYWMYDWYSTYYGPFPDPDKPIFEDIAETSYDIPMNTDAEVSDENGGLYGQKMIYYMVSASSVGGHGSFMSTQPIIVGAPYSLPFNESFANGNTSHYMWDMYMYQSDLSFDNEKVQDNDGASLAWKSYSVGEKEIYYTGKISLEGTVNPHALFQAYGTNRGGELIAFAQTPDGNQYILKTIDYDANSNGEWQEADLDLSQFTDQRYIMLGFFFNNNTTDGESYEPVTIGIDNIQVFDVLDYNLTAMSVKPPYKLHAGKSDDVSFIYKNYGSHEAKNYTVNLFVDGEKTDSVTFDAPLASMAQDTVTLKANVRPDAGETVNVYATIDYDLDLDQDDNTSSSVEVNVVPTTLTAVNDLVASTADKNVNLTWTTPILPTEQSVTEDFESYTPWTTTDFGDWKVVDGSGDNTNTTWGLDFPHKGEPYAWIISNPSSQNLTDEWLTPHSGSQAAMSFTTYEEGENWWEQNRTVADHWLITPKLSGKQQTISFYATAYTSYYDADSVEVLYSLTDNDTASFIPLDSFALSTSATADGDWGNAYSFTVPEGAKYFAIRHISNSTGFVVLIDDVSFIAAPAEGAILGYNVYRDGKLVGYVKANADESDNYSYDDSFDNAGNGSHSYNVTVVYENGESPFSNTATTIVDAIASINASSSIAGHDVTVYAQNGALVAKGRAENINIASGAYIIHDNVTGKVYHITKK